MTRQKILDTAWGRAGVIAGALLQGAVTDPVHAANAEALVEAKVLMTMSIANQRGLSFGAISASQTTAGTLTVQPDGTIIAAGGATMGDSGSAGAATFLLNGQPDQTFTVQLPVNVSLTDSKGNTMTVNSFLSQPNGTGKLDGSGTNLLKVGGTLEVGAAQLHGTYNGLMNISVNYY